MTNALHTDDRRVLKASRTAAADAFTTNRNLDSGSIEAGEAIEHAKGVAQILRENVVQGKNKGGNTYKLNIHEHTQRADNDTAGRMKGTTKSFKEIKNSTF